MTLPKYPKFRVIPCLDNSEEGWSEVYLVQTKRNESGRWMGCINESGPLVFDQREDALSAIKALTNLTER